MRNIELVRQERNLEVLGALSCIDGFQWRYIRSEDDAIDAAAYLEACGHPEAGKELMSQYLALCS